MIKYAILIPTTSNKRNYDSYTDTDLYQRFIKSFLLTYNNNYKFKIYIGIDADDKFYNDAGVQEKLLRFMSVMKNVDIQFYKFDNNYKGDVGAIWTKLYEYAIEEKNEYFLQIGDDVVLQHRGWDTSSILKLKENFGIGVCGLVDAGRRRYNPTDSLITQGVVTKIHYNIFGFLYPPELRSWYIDNFIGDIYEIWGYKYIIPESILNTGGDPRYVVPADCEEQYKICMIKYKDKIKNYLHYN